MLIQTLVPLNHASNQETPAAPERGERALVDAAAIGGCEAEDAAECEPDSLVADKSISVF